MADQARLLNLLRNEGGSVGTSLSQALHEQREQFHSLRLGEYLDPFNPTVQSFTDQARAMFLEQSGDPVASQQLGLQALDNVRQQQASALAYFRLLLGVRHDHACARATCPADEALGR
jgi:MFS transporter, DHA2 family, multidrug resistance protein